MSPFNLRKMDHRRRYIIIATVACCLLSVDIAVRWARPVLREYDVADFSRKPDYLSANGMPEIILMGSSRAKYALVPDDFEAVFGRSTFNLGIAGTKVVEWLELSRRLFAQHHGKQKYRPRLVVLGINASEVRADYLPLDAARHLFSFRDLLESIQVDGPSMDVIGQYVRQIAGPLWASYHWRYELKMWGQGRLGDLLPKNAQASRELHRRVASPVPPKGYDHPWMHGRRLCDLGQRLLESRAGVIAASVPRFSKEDAALRRFEQLLNFFKQQGIAVVVAYIPNSPATERRWAKVEPAMIQAIEIICREHEVSFLPCRQSDLPRTNHDYLEEIHVGLPLAHRISRRVVEYVNKLAILDTAASPTLAKSAELEAGNP